MSCLKQSVITRQSHACPIFGLPKELGLTTLPTYEDVLLCCFNKKYELMLQSKKTPCFSLIADHVATQVQQLYIKSSIPTLSHSRVVQLIKSYHNVYYNLRKSYNRDIVKDNFKKKLDIFVTEAKSKLFDIAACKCKMSFACICGGKSCTKDCSVTIDCNCEKNKKIPAVERNFLYDQRTTRNSYIGNLDRKETEKLKKREERNQLTNSKKENSTDLADRSKSNDQLINNRSTNRTNESNDDSPLNTSQMRISLPSTAIMSDRYRISDRATAAIASCVLKDVGLISEENLSLIIDKNKIRREKIKSRKEVQENEKLVDVRVKGIYFDGRKDYTLVQEKIGSKMYKRTIKEEHISIVHEPDGQYIGHVTPVSGTGAEIAATIFEYLKKNNIDMSQFVAIGCDGTATNTGWKNGAIHNIEIKLQRPLQWFICLLHFNEFPFRHLFEHLDGITTGPASFSGTIGKQLPGCEKLPVVSFKKIDSEEIDISNTDLSNDQKYLLNIVQAVRKGECDSDLAIKNPIHVG